MYACNKNESATRECEIENKSKYHDPGSNMSVHLPGLFVCVSLSIRVNTCIFAAFILLHMLFRCLLLHFIVT